MCKKLFNFVLVLAFLGLLSRPAYSLNEDVKSRCNQVMMEIYNAILSAKRKLPELKNFGQSSLTTNSLGIYSIQYKFVDETQPTTNQIFEFGVTMVGIDDVKVFPGKRSTFDLGFPLLEVRFSGYQRKNTNTRKFDLQSFVQKKGQALLDYQQQFMPYQLKITPMKSEYKVGENIDFKVSLTNKTLRNVAIKDFSANTLFFLFNDKSWGAVEVNASAADREVVLKSGATVEKTFSAPSLSSAQEFELYVSYGLTHQGIKPADSVRIKVVP